MFIAFVFVRNSRDFDLTTMNFVNSSKIKVSYVGIVAEY